MAKRNRSKEKRYRYAAPSGRQFSLVDRGKRGFQLDVQIPGYGRVRETVARESREDARRRAVEIIEDIESRLTDDRGTKTTVRVAATDMLMWKLLQQGRRESYVKSMASHLRHHIMPCFGENTPLGDVCATRLREFRNYLGELIENGEIEGATGNGVLTTLRQFYKFAEQRYGLTKPSMPTGFPKSPLKALESWVLLDQAEIARLLGHLSGEVRPLFAYIANTGLRVGTALATRSEWIDWAGRCVHYPARVMKARRPHTAELNRAAEHALRVAVTSSPTTPFPMLYWTAYRRWCEGRVTAGHPTLRIHDLRHSFVSNQLSAGTPIHVVRDLAGHASIVTTQLYAHSSDEARREAMNRVQVPAALGPVPDPPNRPRDTKRDTKEEPANAKSAGLLVGHPGLEPGANGLRIHCSTD